MSISRKFFQNAQAKLEHTSKINVGEFKLLGSVLGSEKSLLSRHIQVGTDTKKAAVALGEWSSNETDGQDLNDTIGKVAKLLENELGKAEEEFGEHLQTYRMYFKSLRTREEKFSTLKKNKESLRSKIEATDKKLQKMNPESKDLQSVSSKLSELKSEMIGMEHSVQNEEAAIGDYRRQCARSAVMHKMAALCQLGEKMTIIGELGKLLVQEVPLVQTEPGSLRPQYNSYERTEQIYSEALTCIQQVIFDTGNGGISGPDGNGEATSGSYLNAPQIAQQDYDQSYEYEQDAANRQLAAETEGENRRPVSDAHYHTQQATTSANSYLPTVAEGSDVSRNQEYQLAPTHTEMEDDFSSAVNAGWQEQGHQDQQQAPVVHTRDHVRTPVSLQDHGPVAQGSEPIPAHTFITQPEHQAKTSPLSPTPPGIGGFTDASKERSLPQINEDHGVDAQQGQEHLTDRQEVDSPSMYQTTPAVGRTDSPEPIQQEYAERTTEAPRQDPDHSGEEGQWASGMYAQPQEPAPTQQDTVHEPMTSAPVPPPLQQQSSYVYPYQLTTEQQPQPQQEQQYRPPPTPPAPIIAAPPAAIPKQRSPPASPPAVAAKAPPPRQNSSGRQQATSPTVAPVQHTSSSPNVTVIQSSQPSSPGKKPQGPKQFSSTARQSTSRSGDDYGQRSSIPYLNEPPQLEVMRAPPPSSSALPLPSTSPYFNPYSRSGSFGSPSPPATANATSPTTGAFPRPKQARGESLLGSKHGYDMRAVQEQAAAAVSEARPIANVNPGAMKTKDYSYAIKSDDSSGGGRRIGAGAFKRAPASSTSVNSVLLTGDGTTPAQRLRDEWRASSFYATPSSTPNVEMTEEQGELQPPDVGRMYDNERAGSSRGNLSYRSSAVDAPTDVLPEEMGYGRDSQHYSQPMHQNAREDSPQDGPTQPLNLRKKKSFSESRPSQEHIRSTSHEEAAAQPPAPPMYEATTGSGLPFPGQPEPRSNTNNSSGFGVGSYVTSLE